MATYNKGRKFIIRNGLSQIRFVCQNCGEINTKEIESKPNEEVEIEIDKCCNCGREIM